MKTMFKSIVFIARLQKNKEVCIMSTERKIFIGAAWPYANGSLHLGHVSALIGADLLARYFRLKGKDVLFVSGSDCHGTPISLEAEKQGISPSEIAEKYHKEFKETLIDGLGFSYDIYTNTLTENHARVVQEVFLDLYNKGFIYEKETELPYCLNCQKFLPDRYIEGECPKCHFAPARGDQCDGCGNLIDTRELIDPKCKICGSIPEWKATKHFYLKLSAFREKILEWTKNSKGWRKNAKNFTINFVEQGLHDRAITRDIEWGISIPLPGYEDKRIYVWFEAVCGYLSASKEFSQKVENVDLWKEFWENPNSIHYYLHGKDNIPFHTVVWPSIILAKGGLKLPDKIVSSEYLTLANGQFSKSRKWAIWLPEFLNNYDSETLRYYLVINGAEKSDSDFSWTNYQSRVNTELIGHFGNFVHRVLLFINKNYPEGVNFPETLTQEDEDFLKFAKDCFATVGTAIEKGSFNEALGNVFSLTGYGNRYLNGNAPWTTIKSDRQKAEATLAVAGHVIKCLAVLCAPFLPRTAESICKNIGSSIESWEYPVEAITVVSKPTILYKKVEDSQIEKEQELLEQIRK